MSIKQNFTFRASCIGLLLLISFPAWSQAQQLSATNGTVKFSVDTNLPVITVDGHSNQVSAGLTLGVMGTSLDLQNLRVTVDPQTLSTGMALRDRHMRSKIFTLSDGSVPEVQFFAEKTSCPKPELHQEVQCAVSGVLTLRRTKRPFSIDLKARTDGSGYRVEAAFPVKLSAFGIEPPCQLGVCVNDQVKLSFTVKLKESEARVAGVR